MNNASRALFFIFQPTIGEPVDEITIWLNGGPGCSSMEGFLQENGRFIWQPGTFAPVENPYSWVNLTNMLWYVPGEARSRGFFKTIILTFVLGLINLSEQASQLEPRPPQVKKRSRRISSNSSRTSRISSGSRTLRSTSLVRVMLDALCHISRPLCSTKRTKHTTIYKVSDESDSSCSKLPTDSS